MSHSPPFLASAVLWYIQKALLRVRHLWRGLQREAVRTVPALALFMNFINREPHQPPSPLLPAHRGHIHPKVGTMRRTRGGQHTLQLKGIFQPLWLTGLCWRRRQTQSGCRLRFQSACGDQIKPTQFWHDERWVNEPDPWQDKSILCTT